MDDFQLRRLDDIPWQEAKPQRQGDRRVAVQIKTLHRTEDRLVLYTRYDPGLVLERHAHLGDEVVYVLEGEVAIGGTPCPAGSVLLFSAGRPFGPLIAGPEGTTILEVFFGPNASTPVPADEPGFQKLLAERGITPLTEPEFR